MADHDRDAGSRGEEEAPRDPTPSATTPHHADAPDDREHVIGGLRYGQASGGPSSYDERPAPGPQRDQEYLASAHTMPGLPAWGASPRSDSFRDFIRQKPAQIIGAGLIGLVFGALLGGTTVAVVSNLGDRGEMHGMYQEDYPPLGPGVREGYLNPRRVEPSCRQGPDGGVYCAAPPNVLPEPVPTLTIVPEPTRTG
jgi:hypothetical protein